MNSTSVLSRHARACPGDPWMPVTTTGMTGESDDWLNGIIRDRDGAYGQTCRSTVMAMGVEEIVTAPRSPWQNPYVERLIGSVRRECMNPVIVLNERHLRRILVSYLDYYHRSRTHLSLGKDTPEERPVQPDGGGKIVAFPQVGGLHHRYERLAA